MLFELEAMTKVAAVGVLQELIIAEVVLVVVVANMTRRSIVMC